MDILELIKHLPGGSATPYGLAILAIILAYKLGLRWLAFSEKRAAREHDERMEQAAAATKERQEALAREHQREAVHRDATKAALEDVREALGDCEKDRKELRNELGSIKEDRAFISQELQGLKRNLGSLASEVESLKGGHEGGAVHHVVPSALTVKDYDPFEEPAPAKAKPAAKSKPAAKKRRQPPKDI